MHKITKILLFLVASTSISLLGCGNQGGGDDPTPTPPIVVKKDFSGISFNDASFTYDGEKHSIYVSGAPDFANVSYVNNEQINIGSYIVTATISAEEYNTLTLNAKLTITGKKFSGISFTGNSFTYDGNPHRIEVTGAPDFANVTYSNNDKTDVGTYNVTAKVSAPYYEVLSLHAQLVITSNKFTGISFKDEEFNYDGKPHRIEVTGAPDFANVKYVNNDQIQIGTYVVKATISAKGYETLELTATMKIGKYLPKVDLFDKTLLYDGEYQSILVNLPKDLPRYTGASYKIDGTNVDRDNFKVKEIGTYNVSITLFNDEYGYTPTTTSAVVSVIKDSVGGVDPSVTPFKIDNNLKYQTLRNKILEGNFTLKMEVIDDYYYKDKTAEHDLDYTKMFYSVDGEMFEHYYLNDRENNYLNLDETSYRHTKVVGDELISGCFVNGNPSSSSLEESYKLPSSLYQENFVGQNGLTVISWLDEDVDGGFVSKTEGDYDPMFGNYIIDEEHNCFIEDVVSYFERTEYTHVERSRYTIYNIGNTTLNVPEAISNANPHLQFASPYKVRQGGFVYEIGQDYVELNTVMDAIGTTYLDEGEYFIPAYFLDKPVLKMDEGYYDHLKDNDCSKYTFKLYIDRKGNYMGEYASLGKVSGYECLEDLEDDGANLLYYGEW